MLDEQSSAGASEPLVDQFGRVHTDLRLSVTDRCNIRCFYCMPATDVEFRPRHELLTFEEITRFVRAVAPLGIRTLRLTGGEPLVRNELPRLVAMLADVSGIESIALTTNGILLDKLAEPLQRAGLERVNISLDTLREQTFQKISRRTGLDRVLAGIEAAQRVGFRKIRLNAIAMRGLTEDEIIPLGRFAIERKLELRFIEFMPLDADGAWNNKTVLTGAEIRARLEDHFGPLKPAPRDDSSQPAVDYEFADGGGRIGFINPVSEPFCDSCNRLRLTAEGQVRNCLFSHAEWDARDLLRSEVAGERIEDRIGRLVRDCVAAKARGHGIGDAAFRQPDRAMYQIGG